jgi:predicted amidohydrolase YtcJ
MNDELERNKQTAMAFYDLMFNWRSGAQEARRLGAAAETLSPHRSMERARLPFGLATDNKPADPWLAFRTAVAGSVDPLSFRCLQRRQARRQSARVVRRYHPMA